MLDPGPPAARLQARGAAEAQARERPALSEPPRAHPGLPARPAQRTAEAGEAIAAAVALCWPTPRRPLGRPRAERPTARPEHMWRFSGRWWRPPVPIRQDRPWPERGAVSERSRGLGPHDRRQRRGRLPPPRSRPARDGGHEASRSGARLRGHHRSQARGDAGAPRDRDADARPASRASSCAGSPPSTTCTSARPSAATSPTPPTRSAISPPPGRTSPMAKDKLQGFLDQLGPARRELLARGATPYPEMMSHAAVTEIVGYRPGRGRRQGRPHRLGARGRVRRLPAVLPRHLRRPAAARARQSRRFHRAPLRLRALPGA